jgi:hypothetical protein
MGSLLLLQEQPALSRAGAAFVALAMVVFVALGAGLVLPGEKIEDAEADADLDPAVLDGRKLRRARAACHHRALAADRM